jgi:hypothetical protein
VYHGCAGYGNPLNSGNKAFSVIRRNITKPGANAPKNNYNELKRQYADALNMFFNFS